MSISLHFPASAATGWIGTIAHRLSERRAARRELDALMHLDPAILADIGVPESALNAAEMGKRSRR